MASSSSPQKPFPQTMEQFTAWNVKSVEELERAADADRSLADRVAQIVTRFSGSVAFVWVHVIWFTLWILFNTVWTSKPMDPFPFSFLTLVVSLEAIFLSTFILIAGNREARISQRRSRLDLQINLLAEQESTKMLNLLQAIAKELGLKAAHDPEAEVLGEPTQPEKLLAQIDQSVPEDERPPQPAEPVDAHPSA